MHHLVIVDAISANQGILWFCESCQTVPGVQKLLVRIGNIEARQDEIEDRVQKIEKKVVTSDNVKKNDQGRNIRGEGDRK